MSAEQLTFDFDAYMQDQYPTEPHILTDMGWIPDVPRFNRLDICDAYYAFAALTVARGYQGMQNDILRRLAKMEYMPRRSLTCPEDLDCNARGIYVYLMAQIRAFDEDV